MKYQRLYQPITINHMELKNRICMTPIHLNYCKEGGGQITPQFKEFYVRRAKGGAALIIIGGCRFDHVGACGDTFVSLEDDSYLPSHRDFTEAIHANGAKAAVQLYHAGAYVHRALLPEDVDFAWAPSAITCRYTREPTREMTKADIRLVIEKWAEGAERAKRAGYDAVEILGSAGYLITQFLSPVTNQRTDEYGGSTENRLRFPLEVIAAVRKAVGPDYPIIMRMSGDDFVPGSNTILNTVSFARAYEQAGADLLSVTGGWHETRVPQLPGEVPHSGLAYLGQEIKNAVTIPVLMANRMQDPYMAETVLALEQADCIGMARTLLADPDWPDKVRKDQEDELRRCVGCNQGCLAAAWFGKPVSCLVNNEAGKEYCLSSPQKAEKRKRILVIGAGPAGLEFALNAHDYGHYVEIWEKENRIGGQLHLAAAPPGKRDFADLCSYYTAALKKRKIPVHLEKTADTASVLQENFDLVVAACGAKAKPLAIENPGNLPLIDAREILSGQAVAGRYVVIIGGGSIGCETAQFLARQGTLSADQFFFLSIHQAEPPELIQRLLHTSQRRVSIVECAPKTGSGFSQGCAWPVMKDLKRLGVKQYTNARLEKTTAHTACISWLTKEGTRASEEIPCDTIIYSIGALPENTLYKELKAAGCPVTALGDCRQPGRILDATLQARELASSL